MRMLCWVMKRNQEFGSERRGEESLSEFFEYKSGEGFGVGIRV